MVHPLQDAGDSGAAQRTPPGGEPGWVPFARLLIEQGGPYVERGLRALTEGRRTQAPAGRDPWARGMIAGLAIVIVVLVAVHETRASAIRELVEQNGEQSQKNGDATGELIEVLREKHPEMNTGLRDAKRMLR